MKHEKQGLVPRIHGNALSIILQRAFFKGGEVEVFKVAKECVSGLSADQIIEIATGKARIDGDTVSGLRYVKERPQ